MTLLGVELAGPGPEAIALLASLAGRPLTEDQRLSVVQLWQPQLHLVGGGGAGGDRRGWPAPVTQAERADDVEAFELASALSCAVEHAEQRIWQARLLTGAFTATDEALRAGALDSYRCG